MAPHSMTQYLYLKAQVVIGWNDLLFLRHSLVRTALHLLAVAGFLGLPHQQAQRKAAPSPRASKSHGLSPSHMTSHAYVPCIGLPHHAGSVGIAMDSRVEKVLQDVDETRWTAVIERLLGDFGEALEHLSEEQLLQPEHRLTSLAQVLNVCNSANSNRLLKAFADSLGKNHELVSILHKELAKPKYSSSPRSYGSVPAPTNDITGENGSLQMKVYIMIVRTSMYREHSVCMTPLS